MVFTASWDERREALEGQVGPAAISLAVALVVDIDAALASGAQEDRPLFGAWAAAFQALGAAGADDKVLALLIDQLPDDRWKSTRYRLVADALMALQHPDRAPALARAKPRAGVKILARLADPRVHDELASLARDADARRDFSTLIFAVVAMAQGGDLAAARDFSELACGPYWDHAYTQLATEGSDPRATYEMIAPAVRALADGDRDMRQRRNSMLWGAAAQADRISAADPRWIDDFVVPELAAGRPVTTTIGLLRHGAPAPRYDRLASILDGVTPWPLDAALVIAEEGDERAMPHILSHLETAKNGHITQLLARASHHISSAPLERIEGHVADKLARLATTRNVDPEEVEALIESLCGFDPPHDRERYEALAQALSVADFAWENARLGRGILAGMLAKLRAHAATRGVP